MAKVKQETIEAALYMLVDRICQTMPNATYKFMIGGAAGVMSLTGLSKVKDGLDAFKTQDGLIDTALIREVYEQAFKASGGKLQVELFNRPGSLMSLLVKPVQVTITKQDIDDIMREIERTAVVNEVSLAGEKEQPEHAE